MVDGGFRENLWTVHSWMNQSLASSNYELIWVDYTDKVPAELEQYSNCRTICLGKTDSPQKLSYCFNEGIRQAKGDIIVIPDADQVCEHNFLELIFNDINVDPNLVLYILRLDQPENFKSDNRDITSLKKTCSLKNTFNYGGCLAVHKKWLIEMNGYEQLPFFAGYHYNGVDNYLRFKNMGLKIKWHPEARLYHPWHPLPTEESLSTVDDQEEFVKYRSVSWDWMAFDGIDKDKNRIYQDQKNISGWPKILTERGAYYVQQPDTDSAFIKINRYIVNYGFAKGVILGIIALFLRFMKINILIQK